MGGRLEPIPDIALGSAVSQRSGEEAMKGIFIAAVVLIAAYVWDQNYNYGKFTDAAALMGHEIIGSFRR